MSYYQAGVLLSLWDIPALFQWILERDSEQTLLEAKTMKNGEEKLRYLFILAINALPYMKKEWKQTTAMNWKRC